MSANAPAVQKYVYCHRQGKYLPAIFAGGPLVQVGNDGTTYTEDSLKEFVDAIENVNRVLDDAAATQSQVDQAVKEVEEATDALEEEAGITGLYG